MAAVPRPTGSEAAWSKVMFAGSCNQYKFCYSYIYSERKYLPHLDNDLGGCEGILLEGSIMATCHTTLMKSKQWSEIRLVASAGTETDVHFIALFELCHALSDSLDLPSSIAAQDSGVLEWKDAIVLYLPVYRVQSHRNLLDEDLSRSRSRQGLGA